MKIYKKVLEECLKTSSIKSRCNTFSKLYVQLEDDELKQKLKKVIDEITTYLNYVAKGDMSYIDYYGHPKKREIPDISKDLSNIAYYCEERIAENKPEWQIVAEKNDWTPPVNFS